MIIGVDAGALSIIDERLRVGVWRVTYNLLRELSRSDKKNEYRLFTFLPIDREVMGEFGANVKNVVVRPKIGWATIQLPIELRRHPVDVFLGLSQMLPRHSPAFSIGFVYDLGFLRYPEAYPGSLKKLKNQTQQLVKRADHIITSSDVSKRDIIHFYGYKKGITVVYPGIDTRFTSSGSKHTEKHPYILFVGALKRGKNIPFALRVFKKFLQKTKKPHDFVIVGGNYWEDPGIIQTIEELNLQKQVKLKGFVPDGELPAYYRGAEALLITSLWEGFCLPAAEAMACGCPVVYPNTGSLPEIVGTAGTQFETGNEKSAVSALIKKKSGDAGRARIKQFSWPRFANEVYRIITST